jgi:ferric-dicitrate binding protein FerR (iron transport regulator)
MEEKKNTTEDYKQIWDLAGDYQYPEKLKDDEQWSILLGKMQSQSPVVVTKKPFFTWKVAAAFLAICGMGLAFYLFKGNLTTNNTIVAQKESTSLRQVKLVQLTDGSTIKLNSGSSIEISPNYGVSDRNIKLSGQAQFEVIKNTGLPFTVNASGITVTVLGTGFDISCYTGEAAKVHVLHGKVKVNSKLNEKILTAGMGVSENSEGKLVETGSQTIIWNEGSIACKKATLADINTAVKHRFGVSLLFSADQANRTFTGKFNNNLSIQEIADILKNALNTEIGVTAK